MKIIKYQFCTKVNHGTEDEPKIEQVFSSVTLGWSEGNEKMVQAGVMDKDHGQERREERRADRWGLHGNRRRSV